MSYLVSPSGSYLVTPDGAYLVTPGTTPPSLATLTGLSVSSAPIGTTFTETFTGTLLTDASAVFSDSPYLSGSLLTVGATSVSALITVSPSATAGSTDLGLTVDGVDLVLPFVIAPAPVAVNTIVGGQSKPGGRVVFDPKYAVEAATYEFPFARSLANGETISTCAVTCVVYSGTDPRPAGMVSSFIPVIAGTSVWETITGGITGNIYQLKCTITTSNANIYALTAWLAIIPEVP